MIYTSSDILTSIKRNQSIASTTFRFTDDDLLSIADEIISNKVIPVILRLHSDRLLFTQYTTILANQSSYDIPYRAIGSQLYDLVLQDSLTPTNIWNLKNYEASECSTSVLTGTPSGFYFQGDQVILFPFVPATSPGVLRFSYHMSHPKLVSSIDVGVISSVNYTTGEITLTSNAPSDWTTGSYLDFLVANNRSKPHTKAIDKNPTNILNTVVTFAVADIPAGLVAGDRLTLAEESDVLLLPRECYDYVCLLSAVRIMEAQKDLAALKAMEDKIISSRMAMESILTPRIIKESRPIVNRSLLRGGRYGRSVGNITI